MSLVELGTFHDRFEAEIVRGRLLADGVEAVLFDGGLHHAFGGTWPVRLMVDETDRAQAERLLAGAIDTGMSGDIDD